MANWIIGLLNTLIKGLGVILSAITSILPKSPFTYLDNSPLADYLGTINYFIPLDFMITTGETWLLAVAIYYGVQTVLRWIKSIN